MHLMHQLRSAAKPLHSCWAGERACQSVPCPSFRPGNPPPSLHAHAGVCDIDPCGAPGLNHMHDHGPWEGIDCRFQDALLDSVPRVVTNIHLPKRGLDGPPPSAFALLRNLTELDMVGGAAHEATGCSACSCMPPPPRGIIPTPACMHAGYGVWCVLAVLGSGLP